MDTISQEVTIVVVASIFLLMVAGGIVILWFVYQKKQLRYLMEKEELNTRFQKEILATKLETQEETMNQLGIELHDNLGQLLNSTKLLIGVAQRSTQGPAETLATANDTLAHAIQELRSLSKSLNKEWLSQFNLIENLTTEVNRINMARSLKVQLDHPPAIPLDADTQIILFRIIQELLQNAIKHADADTISISIRDNARQLLIIVADNGKGFDEAVSLKGIGILNIRQRTALLGGTVAWLSEGRGTKVTLQIPLKQLSA